MAMMNDGRKTMWAVTKWRMELKRASDDDAKCTQCSMRRVQTEEGSALTMMEKVAEAVLLIR
jgi:hypothetical protein